MDLNFVLNNSAAPNSSSRPADTTFNIGNNNFRNRPVQHAENPASFAHSDPPFHPYSSYPNPYSTISSRSSYSGPSLQSSTAATSPLEMSMPTHKSLAALSAESMAYCTQNSEQDGTRLSHRRILPPLSSVHSSTFVPTVDGPLSPHSVAHYPNQTGTEAGYFSLPPSHAYSFGQHQQHYPTTMFAASHSNNYDNNALLNFAEVAMGSATPSGRRSLEVEAAAEALAGRRGSGGASGHNDGVAHTANCFDRSSGKISFHADIDPELRPSSAGSVASTGRTIEDESVLNITPLFHPIPEESTPKSEPIVISADSVPSAGTSASSPAAPPSPHDFLTQSPKCSYCSICTTGSPLRKVVSHIFGRNKLSTRQIPKNVWVYYCRKHYQRSRYRNPRGFARQQVLLVKRQCERLELWGGVKDWVIKVRRREELRMSREGDNSDNLDEVEDDVEDNTGGEEPEPNDGGPTSGESSRRNSTVTARRRSSTGGNNWIVRHTGMEKTINDIYQLLERIEREVQQNGGKFPDVELLPNVDLAMAVQVRGPENDNNEGASGNPGGDDNQEGADDGVEGRKSTKKRRHSDGGTGSSGGDEGAPKGAKKSRSTTSKKGGDRKSGGKAPSHAETIQVLSLSEETDGFQAAYQRASSPEIINQHGLQQNIKINSQTVTPPSSASTSPGRCTPESDFEPIQQNHSNSPITKSNCISQIHSPPGNTTLTGSVFEEIVLHKDLAKQDQTTEITSAVLVAMAGQSLNESSIHLPNSFAFD